MHRVRRINTVFIYVKDLARARKFYSEVLDFGEPAINGKFWVEFALPDGNTHLALHLSDKHDGADRSMNTVRFSMEVGDMEKMVIRLKEHGVKFVTEPHKSYGFWLAEFEDVEGNHLRLYQKILRPAVQS